MIILLGYPFILPLSDFCQLVLLESDYTDLISHSQGCQPRLGLRMSGVGDTLFVTSVAASR
jgi:hypothetical protein